MTITTKTLGISLGFDTSENLTAAQYGFLKGHGFTFGCRYVPLAGQSPTAPGVIQPAELEAALAAGFAMMFVQFARGSGWSASTGIADGDAAATYVLSHLRVPPTVCLWADMAVASSAQITADYLNGWVQGAVSAGLSPGAAGVYFEPGVPMTSSERFKMLKASRYWATAADDPARFPVPRGCQLVQLWGSSRGQYLPEPGLIIDADVSQLDWLEGAPVAAFGVP